MLKLFFRAVRAILGGVIVAGDKVFPPRAEKRSAAQLQAIAEQSKRLALYQFPSCPFCIKVRRCAKRLSIPLETRNVLANEHWHDELVNEGGTRKVPCLRIDDEQGKVVWLYESSAINAYLARRFAA